MYEYETFNKSPLSCSLILQTTVSKKRLEKFLGGDDLETDIVRHDPSFSTFANYHHYLHLFQQGVGTSVVYLSSLSIFLWICFLFLDSAVTIRDSSFAWERNAEPLLKKYACHVKSKITHLHIMPNIVFVSTVFHIYSLCVFASLSLDIKPGRLVAVVGAVGSGKSSLISALLGEMHCTKGLINISVTTYFCLHICLTIIVYLAKGI